MQSQRGIRQTRKEESHRDIRQTRKAKEVSQKGVEVIEGKQIGLVILSQSMRLPDMNLIYVLKQLNFLYVI